MTRTLIEGKLLEMAQEPKNAQIVTQAISDNLIIFLADENGLICKCNSRERTTHLSQLVDT